MKVITIAVWGLGRHAIVRILPAIEAINEIALVGVCSRNEKIVSEISSKYDCTGWTNSKEMLSDDDLDVVFIASPIGMHYEQALSALEAGKNVWCEKPLTSSYAESKKLVSLAKNKNKMLVEAFMFLYHPQFDRVRSYILDKNNGYVRSLTFRFGIPKLENPGFRLNKDLAGGAFWDVASYSFCALLSLFDSEKIKILYSEILTKTDSPVDSDGRALLRLSNGISVYIEWGMGLSYRNEVDIWTEKGSLYTEKIFSKTEDYHPEYKYRDLKGNEDIKIGEISNQFINMFKAFHEIFFSTEMITNEYKQILSRAKLLDEIQNNSISNE